MFFYLLFSFNHVLPLYYMKAIACSCCGCFQGLSCRPRQASKSGIERHLMHQQEEIKKDGWLVEKVKKVREISEVLAGPKCKNFDDGAPDSDVVAEIS